MNKAELIEQVASQTGLAKRISGKAGRNPQTGATIQIPAKKVPKFSAGKVLREKVQ